jgi:hypothetical protein
MSPVCQAGAPVLSSSAVAHWAAWPPSCSVRVVLPLLQLGYRTGWPFLPHAVEGARFIATETRVDYSATVADLGINGRSLEASMRDTVRWLHEAGHISRRAAGAALRD